MNLQRQLRVLRRHRLAVAVGILLGAALAMLAYYDVRPGKSPIVTPRGQEDWMSVSRLLVTQVGFPEGRVTLPVIPQDERRTADRSNGLPFADPGRFQGLASLYAVMAGSDQVLKRIPQRPTKDQVTALVVDPDGPGSQAALPVIEISTIAHTPAAARELNVDTLDSLRSVLGEQQDQNRIPAESRVRLESLNVPSTAVLVSGRSLVAPFIVFVVVLAGTLLLVVLLDRFRGGVRHVSPPPPFDHRPGSVDSASERYSDSALSEWPHSERPSAPPSSDEAAIGSRLSPP